MIEGQSGLNWRRWKSLVRAIEDLGFPALYRSDHFVNPGGPDVDSLECWTSLTWLADHTSSIEFGPLVSPVSFRDPVMLARMASAVDDLSGGRLVLGVGAGWSEREHEVFGYDLLEPGPRIDRLEEAIEVISRLLRDEEPVTFAGEYYRLQEARLLPRPARPGGPPLLVAGKGKRRMLPYVARVADRWNAHFVSLETFADMNADLDRNLEEAGRRPGDLHRSVMLGIEVGETREEVDRKLAERSWAFWRDPGMLAGTPDDLPEQFARWEKAGADMIMVQWLDYEDLDGLAVLARALEAA